MTEHLSLVETAPGFDSRSDDGLIRILDRLSDIEPSHEGRILLASVILRAATQPMARNAAAIALADLGDIQAMKPIVEVLKRPDVAASAGTLLYAVMELGGRLPIDVLTRMVVEGSYEARSGALVFWEESKLLPFDEDAARASRELLSHAARTGDAEGAEAAQLALECLDGLRSVSSPP